uniref:NADH dehydrogenase subunit 4L n=1 Tax=Calanus simillimus TaxID=148988 RepID=UPI0020281869|nr:NADH dehydrogenase subunit 4L [Calanus simillimus]UPP55812.1 NADH dehydrogenase subunit 4L [Calanus simillimus]
MIYLGVVISLFSLSQLDTYSMLCMLIMVGFLAHSIILSSAWFHVMVLLMIIEILMLMLFMGINLAVLSLSLSSTLTFMFITLSVAEASVGMALLTMLVRMNGNDAMGISIF